MLDRRSAKQTADYKRQQVFANHPITKAITIVTKMMEDINKNYKLAMGQITNLLSELKPNGSDYDKIAGNIKAQYQVIALNIIVRTNEAKTAILEIKTSMEREKDTNETQIKIIRSIINIIEAIQESTETLKTNFPKAIFETPGPVNMTINHLITTSTTKVDNEYRVIEATIKNLEGIGEHNINWKTLAEKNWLEPDSISRIMLKHMNTIATEKRKQNKSRYDSLPSNSDRNASSLETLWKVLNSDSTTRQQSRELMPPAPLPPPAAGGVKTRKKRRRRRKRRKFLTKNNKNKI